MIFHLCIPLNFSQGAKISMSNFCWFDLSWWLIGIESACNTGDSGSILSLKDYPEKEITTHSSILIWGIPWTEKPCRL